MSNSEVTPEFRRGWDAALLAVRRWHEAQASKTTIQARRSRFPKWGSRPQRDESDAKESECFQWVAGGSVA